MKQSTLIELLDYNPSTGIFTWNPRPNNRSGFDKRYAGKAAYIKVNQGGYGEIRIGSRRYLAHRIAFIIMTGSAPAAVDHKNRIKTDNRWDNLRAATAQNNSHNSVRANPLGMKGVQVYHGKTVTKYHTKIVENKVNRHVGSFDTLEEAGRAYDREAKRIHGEFACLNFPDE